MKRIYLDNNATTIVDPYVVQKIVQELQEEAGNPSSVHLDGQRCRQRLNQARELVAEFLQVQPHELLFTSGGTEGATFLLNGFIQKQGHGHIITSNAEHSSVYQTLASLEKKGSEITYLPTGLWGAIQPSDLQKAIRPSTKLIVLMAVNNETGVKTDWEEVARIAEYADIPLIMDGVALFGKERFTLPKGVSAMFFSGHKFHAPKGVGALFLRHSCKVASLFLGGPQEDGHRAGTENMPGIIGFAAAVELLKKNQSQYISHMQRMRDRLEHGLQTTLNNVMVNGQGPRVCNTSNLSFYDISGESLLFYLDREISASHGSACSSGAIEPSRILLNMGIPLQQASSALRFSVSRFTTEADIDRSVELIGEFHKKLGY